MTAEEAAGADRRVRATYEEYDVGGTAVATVADPENGRAWIQSTVVRPVVE